MEEAILKIVKDRPPPIIVLQVAPEASPAREPSNAVVHKAIPRRHGGHLDVDGVLERSLPKVTEDFKKAA